MGLEKAEYQSPFGREINSQKSYKIRERSSIFLMDISIAVGIGAQPVRPHPSAQNPKPTTKPGRQAWAATGGRRRRSALCARKANEPHTLRVTRT